MFESKIVKMMTDVGYVDVGGRDSLERTLNLSRSLLTPNPPPIMPYVDPQSWPANMLEHA